MQVATEVREIGRQVQTNQKRVDSARAARELAERRLDAEEKKFAAGIQISFFVFQAQRDLAQARTNELSAVLAYDLSLVDFESLQQASPSSGSNGSGGSGGSTAAPASAPAAASTAPRATGAVTGLPGVPQGQ